jgi:hypothetical protein
LSSADLLATVTPSLVMWAPNDYQHDVAGLRAERHFHGVGERMTLRALVARLD